MMTDLMIQIEHLEHTYPGRKALDDLSLAIHGGEIFGFLGPNGSGKTTLFRILSTLISPQSGRVTMMGFDLARERDSIRRNIGVVFQSPSLDKQLTAEENLRHQGHLYGLHGTVLAERIGEVLSRVGLAERPRERVEQFSGGMRRRVELAKGLLHRPRILLLDEPSTGLDPGARIDLWRYLRELQSKQGITILLTTHLMEEADQCSRLAILDQGHLVACDAPAMLKDRIGGDVITLATGDPKAVRSILRQKFSIEADELDHTLRFERKNGHQFIPQLIESLPGLIDSVSVGKPTLEDVFIHSTGHRFLSDLNPKP